MKYIPISIPVKPYIKKYIHAIYGQVIVVSFKTFVGMNVYCLLQKKGSEKQRFKKDTQVRYNLLTDKIRLLVPKDLLYRAGIDIPEDKSVILNNMFENQLSEHLHNFCEAYQVVGRERKEAIEHFCIKYDIEIDVDITFDALSKSEYRRRKRNEKFLKKDMAQVSSRISGF